MCDDGPLFYFLFLKIFCVYIVEVLDLLGLINSKCVTSYGQDMSLSHSVPPRSRCMDHCELNFLVCWIWAIKKPLL